MSLTYSVVSKVTKRDVLKASAFSLIESWFLEREVAVFACLPRRVWVQASDSEDLSWEGY